MKKIILIVAALALVTAGCKTKDVEQEIPEEDVYEPLVIEKGECGKDGRYTNKKPALSFLVDTTWHIISEEELAGLQKDAASFVEGKATLDNSQSVVVFMAKQFETGVPLDINDSFMFAVNGRSIGGEHFDDVKDYFDYVKRMYNTVLPPDMVAEMNWNELQPEKINGKTFDVLEMEIKLDEEKTLAERHYVNMSEKYVIDFTIKFSPQEDHAQLTKMLNSIQLN